jgi:hypothetical protein
MSYGDSGGATGWLIGEENRGMACMFTMMNEARLAVGLQGVAIAETATQQAVAYACERRQGRRTGMSETESLPIVEHVDVRRMLTEMRALTRAARAICYATAVAIDRSQRANDEAARGAAHARASLLIPIAKAFSTDIGSEVASLGVQVHGGMGYIEETGAAQHLRDSRVAQIYEGTNGIQAIDLVTRKIPLAGGAIIAAYLGELRATVANVKAANDPGFGASAARLGEAVDALAHTTSWLLARLEPEPDAVLAGATPYLRLFAIAAGGCMLADEALAALRLADSGADAQSRVSLARFFAEHVATAAEGFAANVTEGASSIPPAAAFA